MGEKNGKEKKPESSILRSLNSLYMRLPVLPYLDRPTSALLIIGMLGYFGFVASIFLSSPVQLEQQYSEGPLYKNAQLQLLPGEAYSYLVTGPGSRQQVTYSILRSPSCAGVLVNEDMSQNSICLSQSGALLSQEPGAVQSNSSYGNQSILLFSPWMLAVSDSFGWRFENTVSAAGTKISFPVFLKSNGKKLLAGREAYEISVGPMDSAPSLFYIDSEKRVLLSAESENVSVKLVSAPFELDWPK